MGNEDLCGQGLDGGRWQWGLELSAAPPVVVVTLRLDPSTDVLG